MSLLRFLRRVRTARPAPPGPGELFVGPIRGELLGDERLLERAREIARAHPTVRERRRHWFGTRPTPLLKRLAQTRGILESTYARLSGAALVGVDVGPAGNWFLDNFHVIREHALSVHESLPAAYFRELPLLTTGSLAEYPRVYDIAITLISHTEGRIELDGVERFVEAFQEVQPLSLGELWAVPAMLRVGLLESVRRMALRTVQRLDELEAADLWAARILSQATAGPEAMRQALAEFVAGPHPNTPTFVSRILQQLRASAGAVPPLVGIEQWFAEEGLGPTEAATRAGERVALTTHIMANSITSLRGIAHQDWRPLVERQSEVDRLLRTDPSGAYSQMTFATRDEYRHAVERIARGAKTNEVEVVRQALALARREPADAADPRRSHVGYWLVDRGVATLEAAVGYRAPLDLRLHRWMLRHPNLFYVGGITVGSVVAVGPIYLAAALVSGGAAPDAWTALLALIALAILPAFDIAVHVMSQLVTALVTPRILPELDFAEHGIPAECRTAVVVPTIFPDVASVEDALANLEVQFLANDNANLHYALLSDHTDAPTETREGDAEVVAAAVSGIQTLNRRYAATHPDVFFLFHRERLWNPQQGVWMGWERKRGKLAQFNQLLRDGDTGAFSDVVGDVAALRDVRYVLTLDADTLLPPGEAATLIGTLAHPLNRARFDPKRSRVVEGYGILQPRVGVSLASARRSRFASIHSGHPGVDPYTTAVSDVYQDLYGEGSYTGKGLYDVDAFETATHGRFPENALLSHDLIEGNFARAGLATDISLFDDYPSRYLAHARRKHRWIRGDWQLLPWLTRTVPGPAGPERNRLSLLARWKILDNLRRSTVEIAQLAFLLIAPIVLPGPPLVWVVLGLLAVAAPWILSLLAALARPTDLRTLRAYYASVGRDAVTSAQQVGLAILFLPHQAWLSADAIGRTLWRMFISHRHLLEWQSAALTERGSTGTLGRAWRAMWPAALLPLAVLAVAPPGSLVAFIPLVAAWAVAPFIADLLSRPARSEVAPLNATERETALRYARSHWAYFDRFVTAETAWLAPDNVQEDPTETVAMRTSPTNIGLQLLATVTAHDLGFLARDAMTTRLEQAFASMAVMRRHRGHFLNWYALPSLEVLAPGYVSTVDSGNLAGHLIALQAACQAFARESGEEGTDLSERLERIAAEAERYVAEMEFDFLYRPKTKLFSIGFNTVTHRFDASTYDLLVSEARLASFVAIAKGDVPTEHWFHLGRTMTRAGGHAALVSWSGSMFEYLMPLLVMRSFPTTLLGHTYDGALERQIRYGHERGVPWGISESTYNVRDRQLTYQYRAFGVPDLALQRGLGRELVVAPYASALALMVDPQRALGNLQHLESLGALGTAGFYDALDWTRPPADAPFTLVRSQMAHHVGMTLVALGNALQDNRWQDAFHSDSRVRAVALLLDERVPARLQYRAPQPVRAASARDTALEAGPIVRDFDSVDTSRPHVALLGHSPYTVMVTHAGGGYSTFDAFAVTRWRPDGTRDDTGQFCYLTEPGRPRVWSSGHQPTGTRAESYRASLSTDRVTFVRRDGDFETRTEIVVVPADAAEVRRITVTNHSDSIREIDVTSYGEIVLAPRIADQLHPAFSNLFVETEWHAWCHALTATRRPRSTDEAPLWCAHVVDTGPGRIGDVSYETDRGNFIGRGRSTRDPIALTPGATLSGTTGAVLDPIFALRTRLRLRPGQSASVAFTTLVASSREAIFALTDRYHGPHAAKRALDIGWTSTQAELRELGITAADAAAYQDLASLILFPLDTRPSATPAPSRRDGWQQVLWAHGISGDSPVVVATIESTKGLPSLQPLLMAHRYWRLRGVHVDLLVVCSEPQSYIQELRGRVTELLLATGGEAVLDTAGGVHLRNRATFSNDDFATIGAQARFVVACDGRTLARMAADIAPPSETSPIERPRREAPSPEELAMAAGRAAPLVEAEPWPDPARPLRFFNGIGGLGEDGAYHLRVKKDHLPPAPWANLIANERGGFVVTERGGGFTWAESSYFFRLTRFSNDPVCDPIGEALYLRDEASGISWSPTPAPIGGDHSYEVTHGAGYTEFRHERGEIASRLLLGMAESDPVKLSILELTNRGPDLRRLTLTSYVEWTLGVLREQTQHRVQSRFLDEESAILADNPFDAQFASRVAFSAISEPVASHTRDRRAFLGRNGSTAAPAAMRRADLEDAGADAATDPCAALRCSIVLAPGETRTVVMMLGATDGEEETRRILSEYRDVSRARNAVAGARAAWDRRLDVISVQTPEPTFDALVNRWSLYQALACRMWGRSAIYQSSGAYGFRDQLQDVMAFVYCEPGVTRAHLLRAAARQFVEGDVQHWWHPSSGSGVRTRCSDDLVWLPYVAEHYVRLTGDATVLDEQVPFLSDRPLGPEEHERYNLPETAAKVASLYEHCLLALDRASTTGERGLPLIGSGDWNDGMNRVGTVDAGESVWLAWFLISTLRAFADLASERADTATADRLRRRAEAYRVAVEAHGWDGGWYRRAFFPDGTALGSAASEECRIDSIAQSWSVLSGAGDDARQATAMHALEAQLVDQDARIIRLLTPPFDTSGVDPGYIKGYLPGVRENGAQYTHAALWAVRAAAERGGGDRAFDWFQMLNPLTHTDTPEGVARYRVEPYVLAADVYAAPGSLGRGGWSWYTGAASWSYRVGLESLVGFTKRGDTLTFAPRTPAGWPEVTVVYRFGASVYTIVITSPGLLVTQGQRVTMDGALLPGGVIPLRDDGHAHQVTIVPRAHDGDN